MNSIYVFTAAIIQLNCSFIIFVTEKQAHFLPHSSNMHQKYYDLKPVVIIPAYY